MDRPLKNLLLIAAPTVNLELLKKCEGNHTILPYIALINIWHLHKSNRTKRHMTPQYHQPIPIINVDLKSEAPSGNEEVKKVCQ